MNSINRLTHLKEFKNFTISKSISPKINSDESLSEKLDFYIEESESLINTHNWLSTIDVFPGSCEEYELAYGISVEPITFQKRGLKGLFLEPKLFRIYDDSSPLKMETDPFAPYADKLLYTLPGADLNSLKEAGFFALVYAQFQPTRYLNEPHGSIFNCGAYFGLPVRRNDFVGR